jgi:hypothetical protein
MALAQEDVNHRWQVYEDLARRRPGPARGTGIARIAAP